VPAETNVSNGGAGGRPGGRDTRKRAIEAATPLFARKGYRATRLSDIADEIGVTRSALLKHFGSKDELFFEAHCAAVLSMPSYLDAPPDVLDQGFFATIRYWFERSDRLAGEQFEPYRMELLGRYSSDVELQGRINRFWLSEDPDKTLDFIDFGVERGEVRRDLDPYIIAAMIDWVAEGLQRSVAAEEFDRGLFHGRADPDERRRRAADTIVAALRRAFGTE
jgi:AcrR family transcriptional regulator